MSRKLWIVLTVASVIGVTTAAFIGGFWTATSRHYWREYAQSFAVMMTEHLPDRTILQAPAGRLARMAMRLHPDGLTPEDLRRIAALLERAGLRREAALIWLGLTPLATKVGNEATAVALAERALRNDSGDAVLRLLDQLTGSATVDTQWFPEMRNSGLLAAEAWRPGRRGVNRAIEIVTKVALRRHSDSWPTVELDRAGTLLDRAGLPKQAAVIWLGASHEAMSAARNGDARSFAERSFQAAPSEGALLTLIALSPNREAHEMWFGSLRQHFPAHELVNARDCVGQLVSFDVDPPAVCGTVGWAAALAWRGRNVQIRIDRDIANFPHTSATAIAAGREQLSTVAAAQPNILYALGQLKEQRDSSGIRGVGRWLIRQVPFLKEVVEPSGKPVEDQVAEEVICLAEYVRVGCAVLDGVDVWNDVTAERVSIDQGMARLWELYQHNEQIAVSARQHVEYWSSSRPWDKLANERAGLVDEFRAGVTDEAVRRYSRFGVPPSIAVHTVLTDAPLAR